MRRSLVVGLVLALLAFLAVPAMAAPGDDTATCSISCAVGQIMEWESNFPAINLGTIASRTASPSDSASVNLYTNGDVEITADNNAAAQLDDGNGNTLVTEYQLAYDADGTSDTGGSDVAWTAYDSFLTGGSAVTHVSQDGVVQVTLHARASNPSGNVADVGSYSATQTLTASWTSP